MTAPVLSLWQLKLASLTRVSLTTMTSRGRKIRGEVAKQPVLYRSSRPIDDHETRKVTLLKGCLGDQPLWQLVVEVPYIHALSSSFSPRRCTPTIDASVSSSAECII